MKKQTEDKVFIDTNILVYYFQQKDEQKKEISRNLIHTYFTQINISTQVLGELFSVITKQGNPSEKSTKIVKACKEYFEVNDVTVNTVDDALEIHKKYKYSYYDSLVIASALQAGCTILFSEDMHHGQLIFKRMKIKNPFKYFPKVNQ
ncbi:MAG: PIN domain-containing protein [Bacteroidales bacterium]|nr:PIN domain-containing protein [Bacteroidales bacterium]MCF8397039.1 PIN domain-containing protein [Bacteroidales bacterium]